MARLGERTKIFDADFQPGEDVAAQLAALDVAAGAIGYLVNSHLHFDHTGGNAIIPNAQLIVQRSEWEAGQDADMIHQNYYDPKDYNTGHEVRMVSGEHDLFGDGRVVCFPTYGHTPGHQSLRVRLDRVEIVLTGDACYLRRTLDELCLPSVVHNKQAMLDSLLRLRALRAAGARIFYGHDPEFWATMPQAPVAVS